MRKFSPHVTAVLVSLLLFSLGQVAARTGSRSAAPPHSPPPSPTRAGS